jgi:hypothetical protein
MREAALERTPRDCDAFAVDLLFELVPRPLDRPPAFVRLRFDCVRPADADFFAVVCRPALRDDPRANVERVPRDAVLFVPARRELDPALLDDRFADALLDPVEADRADDVRDGCFRADAFRPVAFPVPELAVVRDPRADDFFAVVFLPAVRDDVLDELTARDRPRAFAPRPERDRPLPCASAVFREINLLKLLFCPRAVVFWCSSASPRSSNLSKKSSHEIFSSESAPLYPGKSSRRIPMSPSSPVFRTHAGRAPRSSAHCRISS